MKNAILVMAAMMLAACAHGRVVTFDPASDTMEVGGSGGKLVAVQAFSPTQSGGSISLKSVWSAPVYTNCQKVTTTTSYRYQAVYSNLVSHAVYTNTYTALPIPSQIYSSTLGVTTNATTTSVTNSWKAFKETVATTNTIVNSATATGHAYDGTLDTPVYLGPFDRLIFTGTGANDGWLRLVLE